MQTRFRRFTMMMVTLMLLASSNAMAQDKPNIVLVFMDNFGWGELGSYGGGLIRGAATPRIDSLADEGLRLLNFNVEAQCTPSRAAIMTGRYAIRTGNGSVPLGVGAYGLTQWEYTMAEMLSDAGYNTGMFGKWHLGDSEGRYPTDQGFDEWYGIPNSSDESYWPDNDLYRAGTHPQVKYEHIMEARRNETPKELHVYNGARRLTIDGEITDRAIDFMKRKAKEDKPFFLFIPYTQTHHPVQPEPTVDELGIKDNTIFIFTADNGPEGVHPHQGFAGPWRGSYFTGLEGSLRVPFLIRWPEKIPANSVSNEIVHEMDLFTTFAKFSGGKIPADRVIDGVDQSEFFMGKQEKSDRESVVVYVGNDLYGVKWRNWKMMFKELDTIEADPVRTYGIPLFYNLLLDPREENPSLYAAENLWVRFPAGQVLIEHSRSFEKEPPIPPGTPDPYQPNK